METIQREALRFRARHEAECAEASRAAAFFLTTGVDLAAARHAAPRERDKMICRLERLLERERLKGARGHWSYDLGRHIALKQAFDELRATQARNNEPGKETAPLGAV